MTPPKLIALCSPVMGSGKSEVASRLVTHHGFQLVKFAGPLKDMGDALFKSMGYSLLDRALLLEGCHKETPLQGLPGVTPRHIMQTLGTEWGRDTIAKDLWVQVAMGHVRHHLRNGTPVVLDDMRFLNEMAAVVLEGGVPVRVLRPDMSGYAAHASEGELNGYGMRELWNGGTLADLHATVEFLLEGLDLNG